MSDPAANTTRPQLVDPLWERQPGETAKQFEAFRAYRDTLPSRRSVPAMAAAEPGNRLSRLQEWCARWGWVERATAWDAEQDRVWLEETKERRREAARLQAEVGEETLRKALEVLRSTDASALPKSTLGQLISSGVRAQRLGLGEATEIADHRGGVPVRPATEEELDDALMRALDDSDDHKA